LAENSAQWRDGGMILPMEWRQKVKSGVKNIQSTGKIFNPVVEFTKKSGNIYKTFAGGRFRLAVTENFEYLCSVILK
jgi:hypothetical protein